MLLKVFTKVHCPNRINAVSNAQVSGDTFDGGCLGQTGNLLLFLPHVLLNLVKDHLQI